MHERTYICRPTEILTERLFVQQPEVGTSLKLTQIDQILYTKDRTPITGTGLTIEYLADVIRFLGIGGVVRPPLCTLGEFVIRNFLRGVVFDPAKRKLGPC